MRNCSLRSPSNLAKWTAVSFCLTGISTYFFLTTKNEYQVIPVILLTVSGGAFLSFAFATIYFACKARSPKTDAQELSKTLLDEKVATVNEVLNEPATHHASATTISVSPQGMYHSMSW